MARKSVQDRLRELAYRRASRQPPCQLNFLAAINRRKSKASMYVSVDDLIVNWKMHDGASGEFIMNLLLEELGSPEVVENRLLHLCEVKEIPQNWTGEPLVPLRTNPYAVDEDVELLQWFVLGRRFIDATVFDNDTSSEDLKARCKWLCEDGFLVYEVARIEEAARFALVGLDFTNDDPDRGEDDVHEDLRTCVKMSREKRGLDRERLEEDKPMPEWWMEQFED